ncbi:tail tube protein [Bacillus phage DZ1]|uniref:Tail tube protein n=1 Tax=Bacillus phage DZ1 TaxID=3075862 RepID=A0AA96J2U7_9CAUD|nr:tail tube protein [Bacillus phage DZ1]
MPKQAQGYDHTVTIGVEATAGTKATIFKHATIIESFEPEEKNNVDVRRGIGQREAFMLRTGAKEVDASIKGALQNGRLLFLALGNEVKTGDATVGFTHTLKPVKAGQELPSFTAQHNIAGAGLLRNYLGGKIDTLTISAKAEEAVEVSADMQFMKVDDTGTATVVPAELNNYMMFYEGTVKINNTAVGNISEFELEIANNLERKFAINGTDTAARVQEGACDITSSITFDFMDTTQWTNFKNGADITVELNFQDISNPKNAMKFTLSGGKYDTNAIGAGAEDLTEQSVEAIYTGITVEVKDTIDKYFA